KKKNILKSIHSEFQMPLPDICPSCGNMKLLQQGYGTEKVQEVLQKLNPDIRISRFDRDEITTLTQLEDTLNAFHKGDISVLVGTQMLAKGHNFKRVNTVLVLGIDQQLNFPDFRALERTYQLLIQIAGRAGRFSEKAKVLIQTLSGEMPLFDYIRNHTFDDFYKDEITFRQELKIPPFARIAIIYFHGGKRENVVNAAQSAKTFLLQCLREIPAENKSIAGPAPAMIERKSSRYSWCLQIKCSDVVVLNRALAIFYRNFKQKAVIIKIDVDPFLGF
ncbi:MAG: primosomal protein N', partial [Halobacteriovoraceae bacterium]|nr:primosomal protein N' [Halobacteriovoraceae bacterium]